MKYFSVLFTLMLLINCDGFGQQYVDLLHIQHSHSIGKVDAVSLSKTNFTESSVDLLLPIQLDSTKAIITGAVGERTYFNDRTGNPIMVYGLMLKAGMNIKHGKHWSGSYILLPRIASDKIQFDSKRFQLGGLVLMKRTYSDAFNFKFGVYTNSEFFSPFVVPVVGFYYQKNRWEMNITLPISGDINYTLKKNLLAVGFRYDGIARSYFRYNTANRYIEKANNELGLYARVNFKEWNFRIIASHSLWRKFGEFESGDRADLALPSAKIGNNRNPIYESALDELLIKFSLTYRLAI
jgi:hypothetical protein